MTLAPCTSEIPNPSRGCLTKARVSIIRAELTAAFTCPLLTGLCSPLRGLILVTSPAFLLSQAQTLNLIFDFSLFLVATSNECCGLWLRIDSEPNSSSSPSLRMWVQIQEYSNSFWLGPVAGSLIDPSDFYSSNHSVAFQGSCDESHGSHVLCSICILLGQLLPVLSYPRHIPAPLSVSLGSARSPHATTLVLVSEAPRASQLASHNAVPWPAVSSPERPGQPQQPRNPLPHSTLPSHGGLSHILHTFHLFICSCLLYAFSHHIT